LTVNDFVDATDASKNYVVLNFDGKSQNDLYKEVLKFINSYYNNPEKVTSKLAGEQIVIDAMEKNVTAWRGRNNLDFYYKISMDFKDNRIRFSANYKSLYDYSGYNAVEYPLVQGSKLWIKTAMFNTKGTPISKKAQLGLEHFINSFITDLSKSIQNSSDTNW